jgi:hypothetical protein
MRSAVNVFKTDWHDSGIRRRRKFDIFYADYEVDQREKLNENYCQGNITEQHQYSYKQIIASLANTKLLYF